MKLLVFANVPPPHHGQSYMVQLMLNGFGGDHRWGRRKTTVEPPSRFGIECYHVDARLSRDSKDIGKFRGGKIFLIFWYCLQAIWCRFRYGVDNFYYVPAPGKRVALYRDWLVMLFCRPFFKNVILHWHAAGLAEWLETSVQIRSRTVTYRLFKPVNLSIVLSRFNFADAEKLLSRRICVVNNGIPDPCPDFATSVQPRRRARFAAHGKLLANERLDAQETAAAGGDPQIIKVLFLAHCSHDKGLFATVEGVMTANRQLAARGSVVRMKLTIAGNFVTARERVEFDRLVQAREYAETVEYLGFVSGAEKRRILSEADLFCFPTCYFGENQPVNFIEAMAFGLPIVTTRWRSLPEMLPQDYPGFVDPKSPGQIADALQRLAGMDLAESLREMFVRCFTLEHHLANLAEAIHSVEKP
ncbi:MAG: glycosyltransferase [Verrucomicrobiota bacterium]|jgi:glycosyltransferase involved in cell wall biosynthesis